PCCSVPYSLVRSVLVSSSVSPLHLHSFPTRRSSDLNVGFDAKAGQRLLDHPGLVAQMRIQWLGGFSVRKQTDRWRLPARRRAGLDRKSTRLNSSHGSISYAVFCLKKKTKKARR